MTSEKWLKRTEIEKVCNNCGEPFKTREKRAKFCGHECSSKFNNRNRPAPSEKQKVKTSEALRNYYANHPDKIIRGDEASKNVAKGTKGKFNQEPKSLGELSKRTVCKVFKRLGVGCSRCGWNEATCDLHHIQGRKIPDPHNHNNLTYLCPNCHRMFHCKKIGPNDVINLNRFIGDKWKDYYYG